MHKRRSSAKNPLRLAQRNKGTGISIQGLSEKEFVIKKSDSVKTDYEFAIFNYDETNVQRIYSMSFLPGLFQGQYHGICCFRGFFFIKELLLVSLGMPENDFELYHTCVDHVKLYN